jgi:phage I-like protein
MSQRAGYWVDLTGVKLEEADGVASSWIQLMTVGKYNHPVYGEIDLTPDRFDRFVKNFDNRVRQTDIDIDYDHKDYGGRAAGWLRKVVNRGQDGLWGLVEWTKAAADAIRHREYRYFSPEFADVWEHPQTGEKHKDVLFGGAITNRPFLKDILPINMTEVFGHVEPTPTGGHTLNEFMKKLAEALGLTTEGLSEDKVGENIVAAVTKLKETSPPEKGSENKDDPAEDPDLVKLSETNPTIARLLADREEDRKRLQALETSSKLAEVKLTVKSLNEAAAEKGRGFGQSVKDKLEEILVAAPTALSAKIAEVFKDLCEGGFVELTEHGKRTTSDDMRDVVKKFEEAVAKKREADKDMSYADAAVQVSLDEPALYEQYQHAILEGEPA